MQTDAGFVEYVEHLGGARRQGGPESQPLKFSTRQSIGAAVQLQVLQTQLLQQAQSAADLGADGLAHGGYSRGEIEVAEPRGRRDNRALADRGNRRPAQFHGEGLGPQARPAAARARYVVEAFLQPGQFLAFGFGPHALKPARQSDKPASSTLSAPQPFGRLLRPVAYGLFGIDLVPPAEGLQAVAQIAVPKVVPQGTQCSFERGPSIGKDLLAAQAALDSEAPTRRAGSGHAIKGKQRGF